MYCSVRSIGQSPPASTRNTMAVVAPGAMSSIWITPLVSTLAPEMLQPAGSVGVPEMLNAVPTSAPVALVTYSVTSVPPQYSTGIGLGSSE